AKNGKPKRTEDRWDYKDAKHKFPHCASSRNSSNKRADKWSPGDPPCPIENGPVLYPYAFLKRSHSKTHPRQILNISTKRCSKQIHNKGCRASKEKKYNKPY